MQFEKNHRGIPNIEGFRDKPFIINNNEFKVDLNGFTSYDNFVLVIGYFKLHLVLTDNDNLIIAIRNGENNAVEVTIKGKGNAKNNCLYLIDNTKAKTDDFRGLSSEEKKNILKNHYFQNKSILNFAYTKKAISSRDKPDSLTLKRIKALEKYISLNEEEYKYLNEYLSLHYYDQLISLVDDFDKSKIIQSMESFFEYSKMKELALSSKRFESGSRNSFIVNFLRFYIKRKFIEDGTMKASEFSTASFAYSLELDFAEDLFSGELLDCLYADFVYNYLFQNAFEESDLILSRFENICSVKKYINYLKSQRELLVNGATTSSSMSSAKDKVLNNNELKSLLDKFIGNKVILVVWSTDYLPDEMCYFNKLQEIFKKYKVVFVCVNSPKDKNLWVFNIINYNLIGNHFFNPFPNNCEILSKLLNYNELCESKNSIPIEGTFIIDKNGEVLNRFSLLSELLGNASNYTSEY